MRRVNTDVIGAQQAFTSTLSGFVTNIIQLVLSLGAAACAPSPRSTG